MGFSLPSVMQKNFASVQTPRVQRSVFGFKPGHQTTFFAGQLIPIYIDEVLPGDTINMKSTVVGRLSTLLFPIMDNLHLDMHWFYCPRRLLWNNWEKFMGAQDNPGDSIDYEIPVLTGASPNSLLFSELSLGDYFLLPTLVTYLDIDAPDAGPFRMYNRVWRDWYRDENLQDSPFISVGDGPDLVSNYNVLRRGKFHDYFTSCLPWPQKGDPVMLPLGISAPVIGNGQGVSMVFDTSETVVRNIGAANEPLSTVDFMAFSDTNTELAIGASLTPSTTLSQTAIGLTTNPDRSGMIADLQAATSATVNTIREAFAFQQVLELDARGGSRYVEMLYSHFGVRSPDFRLQRPEYLGGSSQNVSIVSVPQTSEAGTTPQANLSGYGVVNSRSGFSYSAVEHGFVMGLVSLRADIRYQQGMRRLWSRRTRFDFYLPTLANLGEQAVLNKEIYYANNGVDANDVFGYQERWAEYRYFPSGVSGRFRSNATASLDAWHLALDFGVLPALDSLFIQDAPPVERILAVDTEPHMIADCYFDVKMARAMPVYSTPGLTRF